MTVFRNLWCCIAHRAHWSFYGFGDWRIQICSYCEGDARVNVYNKAKSVIRRERKLATEALSAMPQAREIERLREALEKIASAPVQDNCYCGACRLSRKARAALGGEHG